MFQGNILQSSAGTPLLFLLIQSSDHITGLTGAVPTVTISKNGAAFAAPAGAVTEIANGWYKVAGNATDTNTAGPIALHATAASADPFDDVVAQVVAYNPQDAVGLGLSRLDAAISSRMATFTLPTNFAALLISAGGHIGNVDTLTTYTGDTPQTGDCFARLGAPAGASISADIATKATPAQVLTTALAESYAALHAAPTLSQIAFEIRALLAEKAVAGTTLTVNKIDGATAAETFTLNSATAPTSITRAS